MHAGFEALEQSAPTDLKTRLSGGLSKLNSVNAELDVIPGEPADRTTS